MFIEAYWTLVTSTPKWSEYCEIIIFCETYFRGLILILTLLEQLIENRPINYVFVFDLNVFPSVGIRDFCRESQLSKTRSKMLSAKINVRENK